MVRQKNYTLYSRGRTNSLNLDRFNQRGPNGGWLMAERI